MKSQSERPFFRTLHAATFAAGLALCASATAQTAYDKLDVGVEVSKGILFSTFAAPLPLPPGNWQVVSKKESSIKLSGGNSESPSEVPEIALGLKDTDPGNPLEMLVVTFTPNSVPITWLSPACNVIGSAGAPFKNDFGTTSNGLTYGCARGVYLIRGSKSMLSALAQTQDTRGIYAGFLPYEAALGNSSLFVTMTFSADRGRKVSYQLHARTPAGVGAGDAFDKAAQSWVNTTGQAVQAALQNKSATIGAFPTSDIVTSGRGSVDMQTPENVIRAVLPGQVISGSVPIGEQTLPMPLPQGEWRVASRRETPPDGPTKSSRVFLTLRNTDPKASMAVAWLSYDSKPYYYFQSTVPCEHKTARIVESYETTPESPVARCGLANTLTRSFRERVLNSASTGTAWDKANLAALIPYANDLPDAHTWIELRVGANEGRRLTFAFYAAQPTGNQPEDKYLQAIRNWMENSKDAMTHFVNGKPSQFPPFPELAD
ncbi:hypothetical protein [uncultured Rhodoferax sp.]|uniref:hypothetical protein n=1 Tax=uncultured Rhodoferax sp. TaxID=223188 RepID=UPI0025CFADE3|nr:hypothetical protein [uncultured Rhodoferax sp.]